MAKKEYCFYFVLWPILELADTNKCKKDLQSKFRILGQLVIDSESRPFRGNSGHLATLAWTNQTLWSYINIFFTLIHNQMKIYLILFIEDQRGYCKFLVITIVFWYRKTKLLNISYIPSVLFYPEDLFVSKR